MAGRQPGSGGYGDRRLFLSPEAPHATPRRPRSHGSGRTAQILRHADRRDPVAPWPSARPRLSGGHGWQALVVAGLHHTVTRRIVAWPPASQTTASAAMTPVSSRALRVAGYAPAGRSRRGPPPAREYANV